MTQPFTTIDEYIGSLPEDVRPILERVRQTIHSSAPGLGERISYKMAAFTLEGRDLVYFAGWKRHVSFYPLPALDEALERELAPYLAAKSTARFPLDKPIPYDLIGRLVKLHAKQRRAR